jgi:hypothetical protein
VVLLEDLALFRNDLKIFRSAAFVGVVASSTLLAFTSVATASDPITNTGKAIWKSTSDFFSNLQLASSPYSSSQLASNDYSQSNSGNTGLYFGINAATANIGKYNLKYRSTSEVAWELDANVAGSAQLGWDFGLVRADLKAVATDGGVDSIDGVSAGNDRSNIAVATANLYWDVLRHEASNNLAITPYLGVGGGAIGFHASAKTVDAGGDHHNGIGYAATGHAGLNFEVHEHFGIVAGYQFVRGYGGHDEVSMHLGELGVRLTF